MATVELIFAVHNHQPVGNFDHVIEDAYTRAYAPFLEVLEQHPGVRACLHQPGVLWEWIEAQHPDYIEQVRRLVQRGQLELLSGGYNEPILPVIPERDRRGQIKRLNRWLLDRFGVSARGGWLAERVWEPQLAESMTRAALQYTVVDDSHFTSAGLSRDELDGYYITEENGQLLRIFPIAQKLRYLLPFAEPEETLDWARAAANGERKTLLVHADDGEKFGIWPGTHELCYERDWLERFFSALEANSDWLRTTTFADALATHAPRGRVYLPTASYTEMMEWALPVTAQSRLRAAQERISGGADEEELRAFVRGGFWRNFLARYPESNWMHKKMLSVSRRTEAEASRRGEEDELVQRASEHLWRGQCNCAYWHGLFGGLYLPHLRHAVYRELIEAELLLDRLGDRQNAAEVVDFDCDGRPEILMRSNTHVALVKPDAGGAVYELDARRHRFNVLDLMTRRPESYHDRLRSLAEQERGDSDADRTVSIHELVRAKEPDLHRALVYDRYRRGSFIDHLLAADASPADFDAARLPERAPLPWSAYDWRLDGSVLRLESDCPLQGADARLVVVRRMRLVDTGLESEYEVALDGDSGSSFRFGVELAANLLAADAPDRWIEAEGRRLDEGHLGSRGVLRSVQRVDLVDTWAGLRVVLEADAPMEVWRTPIETVSMSESGFERVYQGSAFLFLPEQPLAPLWKGTIRQRIEDA
jgi:alpha-amylase